MVGVKSAPALGAFALADAVTSKPVGAFFVVNCRGGELVQERIDPIVDPGKVAGHVHSVFGGNGFDFTTNFKALRASSCSTCQTGGDNSVYWTPKLFWYSKTTQKYTPVPFTDSVGMSIYYESCYNPPSGSGITPAYERAFPEGLRMVAGNPNKRSCGTNGNANPIAISCYAGANGADGVKYTGFPDQYCGAIRLELNFPACWDGQNLYKSDNSHVSYPGDGSGSQWQGGPSCPSSHPHPMPGLFYEVGYDLTSLKNDWNNGMLVFSNGDTTGCGSHGDFYNGWDTNTLNGLIDGFYNGGNHAPQTTVESGCTIPNVLGDKITGAVSSLPGCNPLTYAGADVVPGTCAANGATPPSAGLPQDPLVYGGAAPANGNTGSTGSTGNTGSGSNSGAGSGAAVSVPASSATVAKSTAASSAAPAKSSIPASTGSTSGASSGTSSSVSGAQSLGCAYDPNSPTRALSGADWTWDPAMTNAMCVSFCGKKGYKYAGTEWKNQCFCGNTINSSFLPPQTKSQCNTPCVGNSAEMCGGGNALTLWQLSGSKKRAVPF